MRKNIEKVLRSTLVSRYAVVGDDGRSPVVWGIGHTRNAARGDAYRWGEEAGLSPQQIDDLAVYEITEEAYSAIEAGDPAWRDDMIIHT